MLKFNAGSSIKPQLPKSSAGIADAVNSFETSHLVANSWSGSCQLLKCLDSNFMVQNTSNVFVGDASAMPQVPVQPVATVMAMAKVAAELISRASVKSDPTTHVPPPTSVTSSN